MKDKYIFLFTDIEADGPVPGLNSMLSFASVACDENGEELGEFEANLETLPGASQYPATMSWWKTEPAAWNYSTKNPQDPAIIIPLYVEWFQSFKGIPILAAHPLEFDGMWMRWYIFKFTGQRIPTEAGLDLRSFISGKLRKPLHECGRDSWPEEWLGGHAHDHTAISDARGYAHAYFMVKNLK